MVSVAYIESDGNVLRLAVQTEPMLQQRHNVQALQTAIRQLRILCIPMAVQQFGLHVRPLQTAERVRRRLEIIDSG